ncbi:MAG: hypothetical protein LUM44_21565 [Pyrinomonadaceae bacterium]|nr:hypothetical protein [Pyrinomonadaceae bacterium]
MKEKGIGNAFALVGGTQAWKNAGYPMEGEASKKNDSTTNENKSVDKPPVDK